MTRVTTPLAVAADYADALMTARRAKTLLFFLLLLIILVHLAAFFLSRYGIIGLGSGTTNVAAAVDSAATAATQPAPSPSKFNAEEVLNYAMPILMFGAVALSILMTIVMLLLVTIMLVGRLVGVASVTSAFIWGVLLVIVLLPWQSFLIASTPGAIAPPSSASSATTSMLDKTITPMAAVHEQPEFKFPGALFTYPELKRDYQFANQPIWPDAFWRWGRYVGLPVFALLLLCIVQIKSSRGLRFALGEADVHVEVTTDRRDLGPIQ